MSEQDSREERALDALIVWQLRRERDITNLDDLPQLSEEELAAMNRIPDNFIEMILEADADE